VAAGALRRDHDHRQGLHAVPYDHGATDQSVQVQTRHLGDYDASRTEDDVGYPPCPATLACAAE
jgi:hypothetical protein